MENKAFKCIFWCYVDFTSEPLKGCNTLRIQEPQKSVVFTTQRWMFANGSHNNLRELLFPEKDYINSSKDYELKTPALYFPYQIFSGLCCPPLPFWNGQIAQWDYTERLQKGEMRNAAVFLFFWLSSLYFSIYQWKLFHTCKRFPPQSVPSILLPVSVLQGLQYAMKLMSP